MAIADLTIMGAGVFGLSAAWAALARGATVRVIDPGGVGAGASGGIVGALCPFAPELWTPIKTFQLQALLEAEAFWAGVAAVGGVDPGYGRVGRIQPIMNERGLGLAQERRAASKVLWRGQAEWRVERAGQPGPWMPESPTGWLIYDTLSARINPAQACASLAAAIRAKGGEIVTEGRQAGAVLWATGAAGLAARAADGAPLGNGVKGQAALFGVEWGAGVDYGALPQIYLPGLHIIAHRDGTVAVGSTSERYWQEATTTDGALEDLIARARAVLPILADAPVLRRWAGLRPRAASRAPILGKHPAIKGDYIANGGFMIGLAMAPNVGAVIADFILTGEDRIIPEMRVPV